MITTEKQWLPQNYMELEGEHIKGILLIVILNPWLALLKKTDSFLRVILLKI